MAASRASGRSRWPLAILAWAAASSLPTSPVAAQGSDASGPTLRLTAFIWFSNIDGKNTVDVLPFAIGGSSLHVAYAVRVEVGRGPWGVTAEFRRAGIARAVPAVETIPRALRSWDLAMSDLEVIGTLRLSGTRARSGIDALAGVRYVRHTQDLVFADDTTRGFDEKWAEPFVGFRVLSSLGGRFRSTVMGNVGGFGLGSTFAWALEGELDIRLHRHAVLVGRYRYSETEYTSGGGLYVWDDGQLQGWFFGLGLDL